MKRLSVLVLIFGVLVLATGCISTQTHDPLAQAPQASALAELHTKLGTGYLSQGSNELAYQSLTKALELEPTYSVAHNAMALLYERLGEPEKARTHYELAIKYNASDSSAHTNYGSFLCRNGDSEQAKEEFAKALSNPLYQTPEIPHTNLGLCLREVGDLAEAEKSLRRALELNPSIPGALIAMSDLSFQAGQELSARAYMQRYIEVGAQSPRSLWLGVQIERALGDRNAAANYALRLRSNFPDSNETRLLLESESQWQ